MNKIFCVSCGHKIEYGTTKPRFCSGCGASVSGEAKASSDPEPTVEGGESVDLEALRENVAASTAGSRSLTIGDLVGSDPEAKAAARPKFKGPTGKAILEQVLQECASSKDNPKDVNE